MGAGTSNLPAVAAVARQSRRRRTSAEVAAGAAEQHRFRHGRFLDDRGLPLAFLRHHLDDHRRTIVAEPVSDPAISRLPFDDDSAAVYQELRRLASAYMRRERPGQTLQATGLVHEAYLRLAEADARWT